MKSAGFILLLIFIFGFYWFVCVSILLGLDTFKNHIVTSMILFLIGFLILMTSFLFVWRVVDSRKQLRLYNRQHTSTCVYGKNSENNCVEINTGTLMENNDESEASDDESKSLQCKEDQLRKDRSRSVSVITICEHVKPLDDEVSEQTVQDDEMNEKNKRIFNELNLRKQTNKRINADAKRFTFHAVSNNKEDLNAMYNLPVKHARTSRQASFIELHELKCLNGTPDQITFGRPNSPVTPRKRFFSDLYRDADNEDKRRSTIYESSGDVNRLPSVSSSKRDEVIVDIERLQKNDNTDGFDAANKNDVKGRPFSRLPSVIELIEKNGKRLSVRGSVALDEYPSGSGSFKVVDPHDGLHEKTLKKCSDNEGEPLSDDDVFTEAPSRPVSQYFVASAAQSPLYTTQTFFDVQD